MRGIRMKRVVKGVRYDTKKATLLAHDCYWDGQNMERHGRNTYLYRSPGGRYFTVNLTQWQGERDWLQPIDRAEAIELYEGPLSEHEVAFEVAFPDVVVTEA